MLLHKGVVRAMQMLSVLLRHRCGGLSFQSMVVAEGDIFGDLSLEINNLMRLMESERSKAVEIGNLLRNVASEIEAVILDFDSQRKVRWLNRAGLSFLGKEEKESWEIRQLNWESIIYWTAILRKPFHIFAGN